MARLASAWADDGAARQLGRLRQGAGRGARRRATTSSTSPIAQRLVGADLAAGEDEVLGPAGPTSRARRWVPPPPGMMPSRISGWPSWPSRLPMRKSQARASSQPPPRAKPADGGDRRPGDGGHRVEGRAGSAAPSSRRPRRGAAELADVGAGGEDPVAAGDDDRARAGRRSASAATASQLARAAPCDRALTLGLSRRTTATPSSRRSTCDQRACAGHRAAYRYGRRAQSRSAVGRGPRVERAARRPRRPARRAGRRPTADGPLARGSAATMRASSSATPAPGAAARARRVASRWARCAPIAAHSSSTPSPVGGDGGARSAGASRAALGEVEHPLEVAPGLGDAGSVGLVDRRTRRRSRAGPPCWPARRRPSRG